MQATDVQLAKFDCSNLRNAITCEAMTNAIIHADFMLNGILKVEKLDEGFVFTNPGLLKLPLEQIYSGGESKARNQRMQNMLRMIGYGENIGSGFPLILSAWSEKHWLKPELFDQPELLQVKLRLTIVNNTANTSEDSNTNEEKTRKKTTEKILKSIQNNPYITHRDLADLLGLSEDGVFYNIKKLKQQGLLRRVGPDKGGYWEIVKE